MDYTKHALVRTQQRGIPPYIVDLVIDHGHCERRHGADVYFLDKRARKSLHKEVGSLVFKRLEDLLDVYVVVGDDGQIITTAKHFKRLKS